MAKKGISDGVVHKLPADMKQAIISNSIQEAWEDITPLARNEWICWVEYVKKPETRKQHIERLCSDLKKGKRRPYCWPGCSHR